MMQSVRRPKLKTRARVAVWDVGTAPLRGRISADQQDAQCAGPFTCPLKRRPATSPGPHIPCRPGASREWGATRCGPSALRVWGLAARHGHGHARVLVEQDRPADGGGPIACAWSFHVTPGSLPHLTLRPNPRQGSVRALHSDYSPWGLPIRCATMRPHVPRIWCGSGGLGGVSTSAKAGARAPTQRRWE